MVEEWVVALAGSPWVFVALYLAVVIDGFFPPMPSESVVIALASLAVTTGEPDLWALALVSAVGAFTGDQVAYTLGRRLSVRDLRIMRGRRQQRGLAWAEQVLAERGAAFIIAARYVPVGRVAVNMTAGAVRYPRPRFSLLAAVAAVSWSVYSLMLGIGAGVWLGEHPLVAVGVGVVLGVLLGLAIDPAIRWVAARGRVSSPPAAVTTDVAPGPADPGVTATTPS